MKVDDIADDILAQWLTASLGQKYLAAFSNAAKEIGLPAKIESTFTLEESMSLCLKGKINWTRQHALQSFTLWKYIQIF